MGDSEGLAGEPVDAAASAAPHQRIIPPRELMQLQIALISYITQSAHIFQATDAETWTNFYSVHPELEYLANDYNYEAEQLRDEFIFHVMPVVYTFELRAQEKSGLRLLELHPFYKCTPEGYALLPVNEQPLHCREPAENKDFRLVTTQADLNEILNGKSCKNLNAEFQLDAEEIVLGEDHHTLAVPEHLLKFDVEVSPLTSSILSAMLSTDLELASSVVHEASDLRTRLNNAKRNFEQYGHMQQNVTNHKEFMEKLRRIVQMRQAIENMHNSQYG